MASSRKAKVLGGCFSALAVVLAISMAAARQTGHGQYTRPLLLAASTSYLLAGLSAGGLASSHGRCMMAGLVCCWVGDFVGPRAFLAGVAAFLAAHIGFIAAFRRRGIKHRAFLTVLAAFATLGAVLCLRFYPLVPPDQRPLLAAYVVVLTGMMAFAGGVPLARVNLPIHAGALAFYVSDILLARTAFLEGGHLNTVIGYPLYYAACASFALSILGQNGVTARVSNAA